MDLLQGYSGDDDMDIDDEKQVVACVAVFDTPDGYCWYSFDPTRITSTLEKPSPASLLCRIPHDCHPKRFTCFRIDSTIYVIDAENKPPARVIGIDASCYENNLRVCPAFLIPACDSWHSAHSDSGGRITVLGCPLNDTNQQWATIIDTTTGLSVTSTTARDLISCSGLGLGIRVQNQFNAARAKLIVGEFLYMYVDQGLYVYNLTERLPESVLVVNLEWDYTAIGSEGSVNLFQLGSKSQMICLVWAKLKNHVHHICCSSFLVENGSAVIHARSFHLVHGASNMIHCLQVEGTKPIPSASVGRIPGVQKTVASKGISQGTWLRHCVYVGGLPLVTDIKVREFFNKLISGSGKSGAVVNIYFNVEKRFAVMEIRSEKEAKIALKLDGKFFEGAKLIVNMPSDQKLNFIPRHETQDFSQTVDNPLNLNLCPTCGVLSPTAWERKAWLEYAVDIINNSEVLYEYEAR